MHRPRKNSKKRNLTHRLSDYENLIRDLSSVVEVGRKAAVRSVNAALTATYWLMGRRIVEYEQQGKDRAKYGETLLKSISTEMQQISSKGFTERNLRNMRQFYLAFAEIRHTVCAEINRTSTAQIYQALAQKLPLSWSHYRLLVKIQDAPKRYFYQSECLRGNWSVRQLDRQIQSQLYERIGLSRHKQSLINQSHDQNIAVRPEDEIKDPYVLEFLGLKDEYSESDLEDALINHLEHFLLELGRGFTFVARQKRFEIGGNHYRIDLLLYNRLFKSLVLIDLKIGDFDHADGGQMNFYLNWAKREAVLPGEREPVGIILCSGKDKSYVEYALGGMSNKIFVSNYKIKLPKPEEFKRELRRGRDLFLNRQISQKNNHISHD